MKNAIRHGDLLLVEINKLPKGLKEATTDTLLIGSGGNAHTFNNGTFHQTEGDDFIIGYLKAKDTTLFHKEHGEGTGSLKEAKIPDGLYELRRQVEFTNEGMKPVID